MVLSLKPEIQKLIEEKVKAGLFRTPDDLVNAALEQFMATDDLAPGEMERLLAVGDADAQAGRFVDGEEAFQRLQTRGNLRCESMSRYVLTEQAERDLQEIWDYLSAESRQNAQIVATDIREAMELLAFMPGIGHQRKDVRDDRYRFWRANRFIIAYFPKTSPLQIIRIVGGKRDFRALFDQK